MSSRATVHVETSPVVSMELDEVRAPGLYMNTDRWLGTVYVFIPGNNPSPPRIWIAEDRFWTLHPDAVAPGRRFRRVFGFVTFTESE